MALINVEQKTLYCKLVYFGPTYAGKSTSMESVRSQLPQERCSEMFSVPSDRILFFTTEDPADRTVRGYKLMFYIYAMPGNVFYQHQHITILSGVDGVIFIADSSRAGKGLVSSVSSLREMSQALLALGRRPRDLPIILQYNKRDQPDGTSIEVMDMYLNPLPWPRFESVATKGIGVFETFDALRKLVIAKL